MEARQAGLEDADHVAHAALRAVVRSAASEWAVAACPLSNASMYASLWSATSSASRRSDWSSSCISSSRVCATSEPPSLSDVPELARHRLQRTVNQHARGALRPAEHLADLARRHLVDEAQHERAPAIGRQSLDVLPRRAASSTRLVGRGRTSSVAGYSSARSIGAVGWRRVRRFSLDSALRAIWKSHTRKLLSGPSSARGSAAVRRARAERPAR